MRRLKSRNAVKMASKVRVVARTHEAESHLRPRKRKPRPPTTPEEREARREELLRGRMSDLIRIELERTAYAKRRQKERTK